MNIFFLDFGERKCAEYHCDKHVNKMIVEHLQMMSVALAHYGYPPAKKKDGTYYSIRAYKNHPCTLWVKQSSANLLWLYTVTFHLCAEFHKRFGKIHAGRDSLVSLNDQRDSTLNRVMTESAYPDLGHTLPALAMPQSYKQLDPVQAYRDYYNYEKWKFATWRNGNVPYWWAPACLIEAEA